MMMMRRSPPKSRSLLTGPRAKLTLDKAAALLRASLPTTFAGTQRRQIAKELLEEWP